MLATPARWVLAAPWLLLTASHQVPPTASQVEAHARAQQALYHCYPAIAHYLDARHAAWASGPSALVNPTPGTQIPFGLEGSQRILSCNGPELDAAIRNQSCVLAPVVTSGPYYHPSGHPIRQNMAEWQDGLLFASRLHLLPVPVKVLIAFVAFQMMDVGVIDVETCEPIPNALVDIWHANATGFYAGHPARAPHLKDEKPQVGGRRSGLLTAYPLTLPEETFLRAAWPTNANGVSQFTSIFPGYYTGRATHVHAKVHLNWTQHANTTFSSAGSQYVGQFFFPDTVNLAIDSMAPYRFNPVEFRTRNWRDSLNIFEDSHAGGFDPTFEIHKLGPVLAQGLVGFITVGIDRRTSDQHAWAP